MRRRRRARGARSGPRWRGSRRLRACAARGLSLRSSGQELVEQWLRGAHGDLGVVGVQRDLLELVPGDGADCPRRLRRTPPGPATAIRAGLAQRGQQLLRRLGRPGQQGLAFPRRSRDLRCGLRRGGGPRGDGGGPGAASLTQVLNQIEQRPVRTGGHLDVEAGRGADPGDIAFRGPLGGRRGVARCGAYRSVTPAGRAPCATPVRQSPAGVRRTSAGSCATASTRTGPT